MTLAFERYGYARDLVEGAIQGPEAFEPGLRLRLCHARSRFACLSDPDRGTPTTRERWRDECDEFLQEADALARHDALTNTIRDARQLLQGPVQRERNRRSHADGSEQSLTMDDRAMSKWYGPAVLLGALVVLCFVGLAIAGGALA